MSSASLQAYDRILPELPAREAAVLGVLLNQLGNTYRPKSMTNRGIGAVLGLERDSISPRTAKLRQKGLIIESGITNGQTLYAVVQEPNFVKAPGKRKPQAYYQGVEDARLVLVAMYGTHCFTKPNQSDALGYAIDRVMELSK